MRYKSGHGFLCGAALVLLCCSLHAQSAPPKDAPGSVAGHVTRAEDDKSAAGVVVALSSVDASNNIKVVARATTDAEGRYRMTNVPAGRYQLAPLAPAYVVADADGDGWPPGRPVTLTPGENMQGADFRLVRGAVITGRVTDADGKPVVAERVEIMPADDKQRRGFWFGALYQTDDRGVYRVYGLPAGRYRVAVGRDGGTVHIGGPNRYYPRTYHPAATEAAQAAVVEIAAGDVAKDIDISVAPAATTYKASGRIVTAETGRPAPDVMYAHGAMRKDQKGVAGWAMSGARTDERGEFTVEGLAPGRYAVFALTHDQEAPVEWYSDAVPFEVEGADVTGLEVKLRRGSALSGVVQIEGLNDPAARARLLAGVRLFASGGPPEDGMTAPRTQTGRVNADGTFRFTGLRPGRYRLQLMDWDRPKGITLLRVELNGVAAGDGVEVGEAAQVAGVRVLLAYGTGVIRGQINTAAGAPASPPAGARMLVYARRVIGGQAERSSSQTVAVDGRGRFTFEGLAAGEYLIVLRVTAPGAEPVDVRQTVTLDEGGDASVVLVIK